MEIPALSVLTGSVVAFLFNIIPGLRTRFAALTSEAKQLFMLLASAIAAVIIATWACFDPTSTDDFSLCLSAINWKAAIVSFIFAMIGNQATDRNMPKPADVEKAKRARKSEKVAGIIVRRPRAVAKRVGKPDAD